MSALKSHRRAFNRESDVINRERASQGELSQVAPGSRRRGGGADWAGGGDNDGLMD